MNRLASLWRLGIGAATVVGICVLGALLGFQMVSLWVLYLTIPASLVFIVAYTPERPWTSWFGTSLLLLAVGVLAACLAGMLFRVYGLDYRSRELLGTAWIATVYVAMVMRTWVLLAVQWRTRHGVGGWLRRTARR